jgi:flagellar protein FlbD
MIRLHRLGHMDDEPFHLNPDLILTIEAHPDTVVTLTTGIKVLVAESPEVVVDAVREWRSSILSAALPVSTRRSTATLTVVRGGGSLAPAPGPKEGETR